MNLSTTAYILLFILLVIILGILFIYNSLIRLQNKVKEANSNIEVALNKRFDLIPNVLESVKGYASYESGTLEKITNLRSKITSNHDMSIEELNELNNDFNKYLVIVESYPELKANAQFLVLQNRLATLEDEIERQRHIYNNRVTKYNTKLETVPNNIVASMFAFKPLDLFKLEQEKQENIKVEF